MNKFESFSVKDIRKLRDDEAEVLKNLNGYEISEYFSKGSIKAKKRISEKRKAKNVV